MKKYNTKIDGFVIRETSEVDCGLIHEFVLKLADYEKLLDDVVADESSVRDVLFERKIAEAVIGEYNGEPVAFAVFFHNYSTFIGKPGLYLEDLFVLPEKRGMGFGKTMLAFLASLAAERGCGRFEWACLDWNEPAINFYKSLGAVPMNEWTIFRLSGDKLKELVGRF